MPVQNKLFTGGKRKGKEYIASICTNPKLKEFAGFYLDHDGFELAIPLAPKNCLRRPLLTQLSAAEIKDTTKRYLPGGRWAWTMDLNKSKALYRVSEPWIVFAQIEEGPKCLTTFLGGENAGNIYLSEPQPHFDILKPIARGYQALQDRIAKDPAAFLRLVQATVSFRIDGMNFGHVPINYVDQFSNTPAQAFA